MFGHTVLRSVLVDDSTISAIALRRRVHSSFCCYLLLRIRYWWRIRERRYSTLKTLMTSPFTQPISEKKISRVKFIRTVDPLKNTSGAPTKMERSVITHIVNNINSQVISYVR
jgi:hypothetical protein